MKETIEISVDEYAHLLSQYDIILNLSEEVHRLNDIIHHLIGDRNNEERDK